MDEYISRDDVLRKFIEGDGHDDDRFTEGYNFAVQEYREEVKKIPTADVQPVNQWISVKDRLPDESCECLGVVDGEVTEVSYAPKQKRLICVWSMCDADGFKPLPDDAVTHWMPLPELPQD